MDIIPAPQAQPPPDVKRELAKLLRAAGKKDFFVGMMGGKMLSHEQFFALQMWDLINEGELFLADGTHMRIDSIKDWLEAVKFLSNFMDGPANLDQSNSTNINVFKVYAGINVDDV